MSQDTEKHAKSIAQFESQKDMEKLNITLMFLMGNGNIS